MSNLIPYNPKKYIIENDVTHEKSFDHWQKYKSPSKLFSYFAHELLFNNTEFIKKLDVSFRKSFNRWAEKEVDFNRIEVVLMPGDSKLELFLNTETNRLIYEIICFVNSLIGHISWYVDKPFTEIDFYSTNEFHDDLVVGWVPAMKYCNEIKNRLPEYQAKIPKLKFKSKLKFYVYSWLDSMPHEGKFAIAMENIDDKEKVSEELGYGLGKWNTQTDQARETGDSSLERGYCHTITFDGVEDNIAYWYIDAGSAHEGIQEFLLKELSDSGIKIKSVEIQMI